MYILASDTSDKTCSAGVYDIDTAAGTVKPLKYEISTEKRTHSETFMPILHKVLVDSGLTHDDISCYVTTIGPGSFTGIRIGVSSIKGMAAINHKKCMGISSLEALSLGTHPIHEGFDKTLMLPCLDARNKRVFACLYDFDARECLIEDKACDASSFVKDTMAVVKNLKDDGKKVQLLVLGNGSEVIKGAFESSDEDTAHLYIDYAPGAFISPEGVAVAALNRIRNLGDDAFISGAELKVSYCAKSSAENYKRPIEPVIKAASEEDVFDITVLEAESIDHPWPKEDILLLITDDKKTAIIAKDKLTGETLGYIGASFVLDEGEIGNLCVKGMYRRNKIGSMLLETLISDFKSKGVATLFLEVKNGNDGAISLYEKFGFTKYGERKDYYGSGKDALLYKLKL